MGETGSRRGQLLGRWGAWTAKHWRLAIIIAAGITAVMGVGIAMVRLEFSFYSIMPENSIRVQDMKTIVETFPAASSIIVVVQAPDGAESKERVTSAVDALVEELGRPEYAYMVDSVQGRMDMEYFREYGLMLTDAEEIGRLRDLSAGLELVSFFRSLNDDLEREYSGNEGALEADEQLVTQQFQALAKLLGLLEQAASGSTVGTDTVRSLTDEFLLGNGYLLNGDGTMALLLIQPTFTVNDLGPLMNWVPLLDEVIRDRAAELGVTVGLTGFTVVAKDEGVTAEQGLGISTTIALLLILTLMVLAFRMFSVPLISGVPLVIGVVWTVGVAGFVLQRLNIMTAMYVVALLGLGIDFAIHLLTTFTQERDAGAEFGEAIAGSFRKSGAGILMGALTTAVAFFALLIAESGVVRELGVVAGAGILCELVAMFLLVPALLAWRDHRNKRRGKGSARLFSRASIGSTLLPSLASAVKRRPLIFAGVCLAVGVFLVTQAPRVEVEGNIMNMEAKGLESIELQDLMVEEFEMAPDYLSVTTTSLAELRRLSDEIDGLSSVKTADSIVPYLPTAEEIARRIPAIERLHDQLNRTEAGEEVDPASLADEIDRLWFNVVELADLAYLGGMDRLAATLGAIVGMDADGRTIEQMPIDRLPDLLSSLSDGDRDELVTLGQFQVQWGGALKALLLGMGTSEVITPEMLPRQIRDAYISADGTRYLLNAIPTQNPWEVGFRSIYTTQLATVTDRATGMLLAADQMLQIAEVDGVRAAIAALIVIFVLLFIDFRNLKLTVMTLLPLLLSLAGLFGVMALFGIKFDFINIIAVPLLIGMGVDDAVHISHRYLYEGKGNMDTVVAKTGTAVLLTSLTTMIGFASFIPSIMRAMRSTGIVLSVAMALAFFFSVLFHPAVLVLVHEKLGMKIAPWGTK